MTLSYNYYTCRTSVSVQTVCTCAGEAAAEQRPLLPPAALSLTALPTHPHGHKGDLSCLQLPSHSQHYRHIRTATQALAETSPASSCPLTHSTTDTATQALAETSPASSCPLTHSTTDTSARPHRLSQRPHLPPAALSLTALPTHPHGHTGSRRDLTCLQLPSHSQHCRHIRTATQALAETSPASSCPLTHSTADTSARPLLPTPPPPSPDIRKKPL